jgi:hypothetical protein
VYKNIMKQVEILMENSRKRFVQLALAISLGLAVYDAMAATITVVSSADPTAGTCTLRDAITAANTDTSTGGCAAGIGSDTIDFDASLSGQTITLGFTLPDLTTNLTIDGSSLASHVKISGNNVYRAFNITAAGNVVLTHLDIINGNDGDSSGGGIKSGGTLTLNNTTFANNYSGPGFNGGGAIYNDGMLTVNNSTFSGNTAAGSAGGIYNDFGTLTVSNSTFSGNSVGGSSSGGGIANMGTLTVDNSTFSGNSAGNSGGGIVSWGGTVTVRNTILANNGSKDCSGTIATALNNLIQTTATACGLTDGTNGNKIGVDPLLSALADNGGRTQTMAISSSSSPAVNSGDSGTCLATDQRGNARVGTCDIGAYESLFGAGSVVSATVDLIAHKPATVYMQEIQ